MILSRKLRAGRYDIEKPIICIHNLKRSKHTLAEGLDCMLCLINIEHALWSEWHCTTMACRLQHWCCRRLSTEST